VCIFLFICVLPDIFLYRKVILRTNRNWLKKLYWVVSVLFYLGIICLFAALPHAHSESLLQVFIWFNWLLLTIYLPKLLFSIFLGIDKAFTYLFHFRIHPFSYLGGAFACLLFIGFIYGALIGRFDVELKRVTVTCDSLPPAFDGLKIVQISDLHVGSQSPKSTFWAKEVQQINAEHPDLVVMTGDMIDNYASELNPNVVNTLSHLQAKSGKFSILGNHDYGDYSHWPTAEAKKANLDSLKQREKRMGFRLLTDEHLFITKQSDTLVIAGVQNWSKPPFHCYGNLSKAVKGTERFPFVLLLSHDPNHWMAQVVNYPNIRLMLAGHTHGMQLGINHFGIHWSPAQWMFKQWDGLYHYQNKDLYVNRGLGYIGVPLRLGMPPEITVLTLRKK